MKYQIWRSKDLEWDIWSETAIVFPKNKNKKDYFTKEKLYKILKLSQDEIKYYDYFNVSFDIYTVTVTIAKQIEWDEYNYDENNMYTELDFVQMGDVYIFDK